MRDIHFPGRSTVHGQNGMAATSHPLATLAAIEVLKDGGNAVDAAVAASAVLCVVEPMSTGIGGDCFILYVPRGGPDVIGLNGSGAAPAAADAGWYRERGIAAIDPFSAHAVTVPGAVDAWIAALEDYGTLGVERVLGPAIRIAEEGFAVSPVIGGAWKRFATSLERSEGGRAHYLPHGTPPAVGSVFRTPALARTLRKIAEQGREGFYEGEVAEDIVSCLRARGGLHVLEDFDTHRSEYVSPVATSYRDHQILEIPPNGQGITALVMLNILKRFDLAGMPALSAERYHFQIEAQRLAFEVRDACIADPAFSDVPVDQLLSDEFAASLAARIRPDAVIPDIRRRQPPAYRDTVYLTVVDGDRNACSFINSIYFNFGSGIVAPESGVILHCRGAGFVLDPAHPNCIAGGKRPFHTIIPGMALRNGKVSFSFGVMGGDFQPMGHAQVAMNLLDFGMDPQETIDAPRLFAELDSVQYERSMPSGVLDGLAALGHKLNLSPLPLGGGQLIAVDWETGTLAGASDPRKDGCALGY